MPGPANDRRYAETAFKAGTLRASEWGHSAVRPREHFSSVISGEDDDGIVGLADVLQMLQDFADAVVHLCHAGFFQTVIGLEIHHRLILGWNIGEDVHAGGVMPDEERLAVLLGLVHETVGVLYQHLIKG